ncbi:MAG: hypothetical protein FJ256_08605 [Phycisphaerae bacterium]|nr:hypothetical protein [Bacteroidota bacterium]MBM4102301.1 hypothetical protein [Phycisphaerae bacterium]
MTKPSKFWLFLGIVLVCSGVGVGFGAVLLGLYFWSDLKNAIRGVKSDDEAALDHCPDNGYSLTRSRYKYEKNKSFQSHNSAKWYDDDTVESMK